MKMKFYLFVGIAMTGLAFPSAYAGEIVAGPVSYDGHEYYIVLNAEHMWQDVEDFAVEMGGHLVAINSYDEEVFVQNFILEAMYPEVDGGYWIGLYRETTFDPWQWVSGDPLTYVKDVVGEEGNCVQLIISDARWENWPCTSDAPGDGRMGVVEVADSVHGGNNGANAKRPDSTNCPCFADYQLFQEGISSTTCITDSGFLREVNPETGYELFDWWFWGNGDGAECGGFGAFEKPDTEKSCFTSFGFKYTSPDIGQTCLVPTDHWFAIDYLTDDEYRSCLYAARQIKMLLELNAMCE